MARRGKAATRRERQRRAKQRAMQRPPTPQRPLQGVVSEAIEAAAEERAESALERAERAERADRVPASRPKAPRGGRADPRFAVAGPSRLSEAAVAEYHYVLRDVRNIGILVVIMAVLLVGAVILFHALGIGAA
jgi:hypothetical protein